MKCRHFVAWLLFLSTVCSVSTAREEEMSDPYRKTARQLLGQGLEQLWAFHALSDLVTTAPHRLAGSPGEKRAVEWAVASMEKLGFENVHREAVDVPHWERGETENLVVLSTPDEPPVTLNVAALGGSVGTMPLEAEVLRVTSFEELEEKKEQARDRMVFFDTPMPRNLRNTLRGYGAVAKYRVWGAREAAKAGAVAVLVRSITTREDDTPHTGIMLYRDAPSKIPAVSLGFQSADRLAKLLKEAPNTVLRLELSAQDHDTTTSYNVVGEWKGAEKPEEVVVLAGHLDGWDVGQGAHDDGAGCVQALEALRLLMQTVERPKRTLRVVLYMNEEFGGSGGEDYVKAEERKGETHISAIESDRGGFVPVRFSVYGDEARARRFDCWTSLMAEGGLREFAPGGSGVDVGPLEKIGTVTLGLVSDSQRYFDVHHSDNDVLGEVNPRELELGAIAMALLGYLIAQEGVPQ